MKMSSKKTIFKVKDPYRRVELIAKKHINDFMKINNRDIMWSMLDHFFWEAFSAIIKEEK